MDNLSDIPDREQIAADEQRIGDLLRAVEAPAPSGLQHRIAARNKARRTWWRGMPAIGLGVGSLVAAASVALVLVLSAGSTTAAPTVVTASLVALERPTGPAPATLVAPGTGIVFPDWAARGWPRTGARSDRIGGRTVTTEFFRSYESGTVGYAIVAGTPLRPGASGITTVEHGTRYVEMSAGGAHIVTWVQDGHTCILASRMAPAAALLALATVT
jgi:hypothetical protein